MDTSVSFLLAFSAGLISFLSPCVLPLIPSYISFISGASYDELRGGSTRRGFILLRTAFFVAGFSVVFMVLGLLFSGPALLFSPALQWINLVAGLIVVLLGLNILFDLVSLLQSEKRVHLKKRPGSVGGAAVAGMAFGAGWSPCIGPILASILFLAGSSGEMGRAASLLLVYSLGLGLPFLAAGFAFDRVSGYLERIRPWMGRIRVFSGLFLILMGLLIAFGRFQQLNGILISAGIQLEGWSTADPDRARLVFGVTLTALALAYPVTSLLRGRLSTLRPVATTFSAVLLVIALLQWSGVVDLGFVVSQWLMFQGI